MRRFKTRGWTILLFAALIATISCSKPPDPKILVMMIESSPTNLDPRVGLDAQSERIDELIFDALLTRDDHLNVQPGLAEHCEAPDPLTYVFHLRQGIKFHNGQALTARDVKWTFDSLLQGKIRSTKSAAYRFVDHIEASDDKTVIFHLKQPDASLLWNLSEGAIGIVPEGSGSELSTHPVGSGPFRFISQEQDKEVILARNDSYWGAVPKLEGVRFMVVPDDTTRALELRKGSADVAINALPFDTVLTLEHEPKLQILSAPGTVLAYLSFNLHDPILKNTKVRQALACAIDRRPLIHYVLRDFAKPANSLLPPQSWAYDGDVPRCDYDPPRARQLLDRAGYPARNGVRFHLTMKTSTEGSTRLLAAVLQQQLRDVGIALDIRSYEFATFLSDVTHGVFQMYSLRWIGGNEDPDMFEYVFHSSRIPPKGGNRSFYENPRLDLLIDQARMADNRDTRKQLYDEVQRILAEDVPAINLWYYDNVLVATKRVSGLTLNPSGNYDFLKTAGLSERTDIKFLRDNIER